MGILFGDGIDPPIIYTKSKGTILFFTRQTGDARLDFDGSITPVLSMSFRILSSDSFAANGGLRGDCLIGLASPVYVVLNNIAKT